MGPMLGLGLPTLLNVGAMLKFSRYWRAGFDVGFTPQVKLDYFAGAGVKYTSYDAYLRLHPFGGGFFLNAGVGRATLTSELEKVVDTDGETIAGYKLPQAVTYRTHASASSFVLILLLGYQYTADSGFCIGLDVGAQVPIAQSDAHFEREPIADLPTNLVDEYLAPADAAVQRKMARAARFVLPQVNLRVGWLF
jgi:hypothetical protein